MKAVCAAAVASFGAVSAFAPSAFTGNAVASRVASRGTMSMASGAVEDMLGSDVETSGVWDPLNLSKDEGNLFKYRAVELKHGRVAMLATLGVLVQNYVHLPDPVFSNPRPLAALSQILAERPLAFWQIFLAIGAVELSVGRQDLENKAPGDLGSFGDFAKPSDELEWEKTQLRELKNGRLAQVALIGMLVQETLTGQSPIEQLQVGHISPFGDGQGFF